VFGVPVPLLKYDGIDLEIRRNLAKLSAVRVRMKELKALVVEANPR